MKIIKLFFSIKVYLWLVLSFLLLLCGVWGYGYISGEKSNQQEVSIHTAIESVEQVNELVFLNTAVQKIVTAKNYYQNLFSAISPEIQLEFVFKE